MEVAGEVGETHHAAFEIHCATLSDPTVRSPAKYSDYVTIASSHAGIQCCARIDRREANGQIGVYGQLGGFRGEGVMDFTLIGFRGEQVVSTHHSTGRCTWTKLDSWGYRHVSSARLLSVGYVSRADPTAHVLVTFHLKMS